MSRTTPRAYVDRAVADVAAATALANRAALAWELPSPELLRVGMNAIFAAGEVVLRVGAPNAPATASIALARALTDRGLRVTLPRRDDVLTDGPLSVSCWEHIDRSGGSIDWCEVGRMVRMLHDLDVSVVPTEYPVSAPAVFPWWDFEALLADVGDVLDDRALVGITAAIERWPDWRDATGSVVCHGDVHPGNVVMSSDGPVLIDWDLLCRAPRGWDHAPMMTWTSRWGGPPGVYEELARGYGESFAEDPNARAFAELRLVAATLMRVRAGRSKPAARAEAERRLAHWRGDPDAPMWSAQ